jgi:D-alanine-D-alanine ligase
MTKRIKVAVLYGGRSNEHSVSCVSAGSILGNLDPRRYEAVPIGITAAGAWVPGVTDPAQLSIRDRVLPIVPAGPAAEPGTLLDGVDVVFPVLHGPYGEDGTVQGLLELAGIPYVGPGVLGSATAMDKEYTKKLLACEGLPIGTQVVLRPGVAGLDAAQRELLGLPVFVKPARGGSSIGITKVDDWDQLDAAIGMARKHDPKVIVEAAIVGREVECGVLEFPDGRVRASVVAEILVPETGSATGEDADGHDFYDFDAKYLDDVYDIAVPAHLDDEVVEQIRELSVRAFRALYCQGMARVDFFVTADGPVINEVNTLPGFTPISMYPRMWEVAGIDYPTLISTLVETALVYGTGLR